MPINKNNILKSFFIRAMIVLIVTLLISSLAISFYQNYTFTKSLADNIKDVVDQKISNYNKKLNNIDKQLLMNDTKEFMRKLGFLSVEIYDNSKNEILNIDVKGKRYEDKLILLKNHDEYLIHTFPKKDMEYSFFELEDENYFIQIFYPIYKDNIKLGYIEAISLLDPIVVNRFKRGMIFTISTVILTVLIFTVVIFPLVFFAYKKLERNRMELLSSNMMTLSTLGNAIALRDSDTNAHNYRVTIYAILLAEHINLEKEDIKKLIKGAFLHDVGKIGIPDNILLKNGKLDSEEFDIMKKHVNKGVDLVFGNIWLEDSIDVIVNHHEKFAGGGYPNNKKGKDIPLTARIFSIVDVFDALTSKRPYKEPFSYEKSLSLLNDGSGNHFDPDILNSFFCISSDLYENIRLKKENELKEHLNILVKKYFMI
jgi:putative nucleotidyltransferase with HDIG domain